VTPHDPEILPPDDPAIRLFLRHALATLTYRAGKTVRGTPDPFGDFRASADSPSCIQILSHMGDLMDWLLRIVKGEPKWTTATPLRRLSGYKMKGGSYARADIVVGRVGLDQTPPDPKFEFD
jgi:hypothetical protein